MKKIIQSFFTVVLAACLLCACTNKDMGTVGGAAIGGVAGGAITGSPVGAVVGAVGGGLVGRAVTN